MMDIRFVIPFYLGGFALVVSGIVVTVLTGAVLARLLAVVGVLLVGVTFVPMYVHFKDEIGDMLDRRGLRRPPF